MSIPGELKLSTITDPFTGRDDTLPLHEVKAGLESLQVRLPKLEHLSPVKLFYSGKAGPNHPSSIQGIFHDIIAWSQNPDLLVELERYCYQLPGGFEFFNRMFPSGAQVLSDLNPEPLHLGRLALKQEAAGKIRVFAITDVITQSVNEPLHSAIFAMLKKIPMDGTFDQLRPLGYLIDAWKGGLVDAFHSYDLSAATDRLPIQIQQDILTVVFGYQFSQS
jgi:hypothetical protein